MCHVRGRTIDQDAVAAFWCVIDACGGKLPRRPGVATSMIAAGAALLFVSPATAQRYDPAYPVCLQRWGAAGGYQHRL